MKFLFLTDFHGDHRAYRDAFQAAQDLKCQAIVNAGDCLPKTFNPHKQYTTLQRAFFMDWYIPNVVKLKMVGIDHYMMWGNDDSRGSLDALDRAHDAGLLTRLDSKGWHQLGGYEIIGFPWVPDYPFQLKDWCAGDLIRTEMAPKQFGAPMFSNDKTLYYSENDDWYELLEDTASIQERLAVLPAPKDYRKSILFMHTPPAHGGLDVCADKRAVGSKAGLHHLVDKQYLLTMHGHIHESPRTSGRWYAHVGDTLCVQPGACPPMYTLVDMDDMSVTHPHHGVVKIPS